MLILTKIFKMSLNYLNQTFSHSKQSLEVGFCFVLFWYQSSRLWPRGLAVRPSDRQTLNRSVTTGARTRNEWEGRTGFLSRLISQHTSVSSRIKETHFKWSKTRQSRLQHNRCCCGVTKSHTRVQQKPPNTSHWAMCVQVWTQLFITLFYILSGCKIVTN